MDMSFLKRGPRAQALNTPSRILPGVLLVLLASGCAGPMDEEAPPLPMSHEPSLLRTEQELASLGLGTNGLTLEGLASSGQGLQGLSPLGLVSSSMEDSAFTAWFNQSPDVANMVMRYVVMCALPQGESLSWTNPTTQAPYTWTGALGLAPDWASGLPATEAEQQVITACLAAHTNRFGIGMPFSILGTNALGVPLPVTHREFGTFDQKEGCFFGNLFTGEGIFAGNSAFLSPSQSSSRACGLERPHTQGDVCAPIHHVGHCTDVCEPGPLGQPYLSCTHNGKSYRPMATRIRSQDIYHCGDGVCQVSESCGTELVPDRCRDCGPCP